MKPVALLRLFRLLLAPIAKVTLLVVSPIFMIPLQRKSNYQVRPKAHLLALHGLIVLVMQAVFVAVVGDMGTLEIVLITVFGLEALGLVAFLRAPSVEFEVHMKDQIIISEWFKDSLWQGTTEAELAMIKKRLDHIEERV